MNVRSELARRSLTHHGSDDFVTDDELGKDAPLTPFDNVMMLRFGVSHGPSAICWAVLLHEVIIRHLEPRTASADHNTGQRRSRRL